MCRKSIRSRPGPLGRLQLFLGTVARTLACLTKIVALAAEEQQTTVPNLPSPAKRTPPFAGRLREWLRWRNVGELDLHGFFRHAEAACQFCRCDAGVPSANGVDQLLGHEEIGGAFRRLPTGHLTTRARPLRIASATPIRLSAKLGATWIPCGSTWKRARMLFSVARLLARFCETIQTSEHSSSQVHRIAAGIVFCMFFSFGRYDGCC